MHHVAKVAREHPDQNVSKPLLESIETLLPIEMQMAHDEICYDHRNLLIAQTAEGEKACIITSYRPKSQLLTSVHIADVANFVTLSNVVETSCFSLLASLVAELSEAEDKTQKYEDRHKAMLASVCYICRTMPPGEMVELWRDKLHHITFPFLEKILFRRKILAPLPPGAEDTNVPFGANVPVSAFKTDKYRKSWALESIYDGFEGIFESMRVAAERLLNGSAALTSMKSFREGGVLVGEEKLGEYAVILGR